jgi:hypothetical protein
VNVSTVRRLEARGELHPHIGATQTNWGVAVLLHAAQDVLRLGRWSMGVVTRLTSYH